MPTVHDVAYLFGEVRRRWPSRSLSRLEVRRALAGVRPLARAGGPLGRVSREDRLLARGPALHHRRRQVHQLPRGGGAHAGPGRSPRSARSARPCGTRERPLPGAGAGTREQAQAQARARALELQHVGNAGRRPAGGALRRPVRRRRGAGRAVPRAAREGRGAHPRGRGRVRGAPRAGAPPRRRAVPPARPVGRPPRHPPRRRPGGPVDGQAPGVDAERAPPRRCSASSSCSTPRSASSPRRRTCERRRRA